MSLSSNFPTIKPSLNLDFANVGRLDPRITFTRASTATYYDGVTTAVAEQNLLLQSQDFTTTWGNTRSTDVANTDTAPDGTVTADSLLQESGQTVAGNVSQTASVQPFDYVISVFAKPNGKNFLRIVENLQTGSTVVTFFDVQNGTIGTTGSGHTATITASTNGYYRCSVKFTANAARSGSVFLGLADSDNSVVVVDSGGLYLWGAQLEQRSSVTAYTATTTQPITNYVPVLLTAQNDVPRFDHNPTTGVALGLLIEEQRTNSLTYSQDFGDSAWTKNNSSALTDVTTAPDGTSTADSLADNTTNDVHNVARSIAWTAGAVTASFFVKYFNHRWIQIRIGASGNQFWGSFDLLNGVVGSATAGATTTMTSVGNGWYRITVSATLTTAGSANFLFQLGNADVTALASYVGTGTLVYIWGAQLEAGAFATSYIPTTTTALTRNADVASMTGTNFSSWFNASQGTLLNQFSVIGYQSTLAFPSSSAISDNTNSNRYSLANTNTGANLYSYAEIASGGVTQAGFFGASGSVFGVNAVRKVALTYATNDCAFTTQGLSAQTDTSVTLPTVDRLYIGLGATGSGPINGHIQRIAYYPTRLPNATLVALTA